MTAKQFQYIRDTMHMTRIHWHWKHWSFGSTFRLNSSFMWGLSPYTSYCFGPLEVRVYEVRR